MSKNNTIKKSDKKFIRREKARIRGLFLDVKKQEEMINKLYKKFLNKATEAAKETRETEAEEVKNQEAEIKVKKIKSKTEKVVKSKGLKTKNEKKHDKA